MCVKPRVMLLSCRSGVPHHFVRARIDDGLHWPQRPWVQPFGEVATHLGVNGWIDADERVLPRFVDDRVEADATSGGIRLPIGERRANLLMAAKEPALVSLEVRGGPEITELLIEAASLKLVASS